MKYLKSLIVLVDIVSATSCKNKVKYVSDAHYINGLNYLLADYLEKANLKGAHSSSSR
jgi:hypothetical protein